MKAELEARYPELEIDIVTVNGSSYEPGLEELFADTTLPAVQDNASAAVWRSWTADWRDVYVLDRANAVTAVYNLTDNDLADPANQEALIDLFVAAGAR